MGKFSWSWAIAFACVFWGIAILFNQHHLSNLIPTLGAYLLCFGLGTMLRLVWETRKR